MRTFSGRSVWYGSITKYKNEESQYEFLGHENKEYAKQ